MSDVPTVAVHHVDETCVDASTAQRDAPPVASTASGSASGSASGAHRTTSKWVLALQIYHALQEYDDARSRDRINNAHTNAYTHTDAASGASILDELVDVGIGQETPLCGVLPTNDPRRASWVIPARGTPEHADVSLLHTLLQTDAALLSEARELTRLRADNARMASLLS